MDYDIYMNHLISDAIRSVAIFPLVLSSIGTPLIYKCIICNIYITTIMYSLIPFCLIIRIYTSILAWLSYIII